MNAADIFSRWCRKSRLRGFRTRVAHGNRARGLRNWSDAAIYYREALEFNPLAAPIWVQYGHSVKEQGFYEQAEAAYRIAIALNGTDADAHLQLGHALKLQDKFRDATEAYTAALRADPTLANARHELEALQDHPDPAIQHRADQALASIPNSDGPLARVPMGVVSLEQHIQESLESLEQNIQESLEQQIQERMAEEVRNALRHEFDVGLSGPSMLSDMLGGLWDNLGQLQAQVQGAVEAIHALSAGRVDSREVSELSDRVKEATDRIEALERDNLAATSHGGHIAEQLADLRAISEQAIADTERMQAHLRDISGRLDELSRDSVRPGNLDALRSRVEFIRRELMYEFRSSLLDYARPKAATITSKIININKVAQELGRDMLRLNVGCGHIPIEQYVNVDARDLPGVDVIAEATDLPFDDGVVAEIYSSHLLEHFPEEILRRVLLPHWRKKLRVGGMLRIVVPDAEAMIKDYIAGQMPFQDLRDVTFGGQDYGGDFHYTMFTTDHLEEALRDMQFTDIVVTAQGRGNGTCREMEIVGVRKE